MILEEGSSYEASSYAKRNINLCRIDVSFLVLTLNLTFVDRDGDSASSNQRYTTIVWGKPLGRYKH